MFLPRIKLPDKPITIQLVLRDLVILCVFPYTAMFSLERTP